MEFASYHYSYVYFGKLCINDIFLCGMPVDYVLGNFFNKKVNDDSNKNYINFLKFYSLAIKNIEEFLCDNQHLTMPGYYIPSFLRSFVILGTYGEESYNRCIYPIFLFFINNESNDETPHNFSLLNEGKDVVVWSFNDISESLELIRKEDEEDDDENNSDDENILNDENKFDWKVFRVKNCEDVDYPFGWILGGFE